MFTGIIEEVGTVLAFERGTSGARLTIQCSSVLADATVGASIAVNGACLTAVDLMPDRWSADLARETLERTSLGDVRVGVPVNLERPLRAGGRLDGHFVLGHIDGTATVTSLDSIGDENWWLSIRVPEELARYIVSKGSVAVDGVSLTVAAIEGSLVSFAIVPHTYRHTALHASGPGKRVNIEVDILAKHLAKLVGKD